jgi:Flp pilus assembly protein TadB
MWAVIWARIPAWLKIGVAIVLAVLAAYQFGKWSGAKEAKVAAQMQAIKEASNRISNMEKNNADFRSKSARDRCLVLMRDSGLPDSGCD